MEELINNKDLRFSVLPNDIRRIIQALAGCPLCKNKETLGLGEVSLDEFASLKQEINKTLYSSFKYNSNLIDRLCPDKERFPFLSHVIYIDLIDYDNGYVRIGVKQVDATTKEYTIRSERGFNSYGSLINFRPHMYERINMSDLIFDSSLCSIGYYQDSIRILTNIPNYAISASRPPNDICESVYKIIENNDCYNDDTKIIIYLILKLHIDSLYPISQLKRWCF